MAFGHRGPQKNRFLVWPVRAGRDSRRVRRRDVPFELRVTTDLTRKEEEMNDLVMEIDMLEAGLTFFLVIYIAVHRR
jgi:hypothetical protein